MERNVWMGLLAFVLAIPLSASGQVEVKNLEFKKRHDLTWDVSWKIDVVNRGAAPVRVRLEFAFLGTDGLPVAESHDEITVAAGDSITYRKVRPFTPATYDAISSMVWRSRVSVSPSAYNP